MASRIVKLPPEIAEKIAAGEVVERPISVVKELVENSLDAGATKVEVFIEEGGKKLIKVQDDGIGMNPEEMRISLERHATSKLKSVEDLFAISTLGFRGEALPSMAAISKFTLRSAPRENSSLSGFEIQIEGGKILHEREAGHPPGTSIEVTDLFYNTPARLKFLKSNETEWGHIEDYLTAMAMVFPETQFVAYHNGKEKLRYSQKDYLARLGEIWGHDVMEGLYSLEETRSGISLKGFIGHPHLSKAYSSHLYTFLNKRHLKDRLLNHAVMAGYKNYLMKDQFPMVVLYLEVPAEFVDVNVHPSKREVRFVQPNVIHQFVAEAIQKKLASAPWAKNAVGAIHELPVRFDNIPTAPPLNLRGGQEGMQTWFQQNYQPLKQAQSEVQVGKLPFNTLQVIGQLKGTYILCQTEEHFVLVDQHAAHERIGFEKLKAAYAQGNMESQTLLLGEALELKEADKELLLSHRESFEKLGLQIEDFGNTTLVVKAIPVLLGRTDVHKLLEDIVDDLKKHERSQKIEERLDDVFATMACHRQIRAGDQLNHFEMRELISQLDEDAKNYHCPHGRPVMVQIPYREIEKWFKRVL